VHKVTILPRGRALGYTLSLPTEDKFLVTRAEMMDQLAMLLGGRTAEELVFHEPTTGAANDIEKATSIARNMITQYGMSEKLGARKFGQENGEVFLGRDMGHQRDYSEEIASTIDDEVRRLIESSHDEAWEILVEYRDVLDDLVLELMEKETLQKDEVLRIFARVQKRPHRGSYTGYGKRQPSEKAPVLTPREVAVLASGGLDAAPGSNGSVSNGSASNGSSSNGASHGSSQGSTPVPNDDAVDGAESGGDAGGATSRTE
jgi:cell division protease FtsH